MPRPPVGYAPAPYPAAYPAAPGYAPPGYPAGFVPTGIRTCHCTIPGACMTCRNPTWARYKCKKCRGTGYKMKNGKLCKRCFKKSRRYH
jgi:hypothetical protein